MSMRSETEEVTPRNISQKFKMDLMIFLLNVALQLLTILAYFIRKRINKLAKENAVLDSGGGDPSAVPAVQQGPAVDGFAPTTCDGVRACAAGAAIRPSG